jgi:hypothetical protein
MVRRHYGRILSKKNAAFVLAGASVSSVFIAIAALPVSADSPQVAGRANTDPGDTVTRNSGITSVQSPTKNRGFQHTSTTTTDGTTSVQNALCKRTKVCNITQKVIVVSPEGVHQNMGTTQNTAPTAIERPAPHKSQNTGATQNTAPTTTATPTAVEPPAPHKSQNTGATQNTAPTGIEPPVPQTINPAPPVRAATPLLDVDVLLSMPGATVEPHRK